MKTYFYSAKEETRYIFNRCYVCLLLGCIGLTMPVNAQIINHRTHVIDVEKHNSETIEISANNTDAHIMVNVIYNAVPDGYHITFTKSFIGITVANVEQQMNDAVESLFSDVSTLQLSKKDMVADVTALDPVFDFMVQDNADGSSTPSGYKVTENMMFNVKSVHTLRKLYKICLQHSVYDIVGVQAYYNNSKPVYDSLHERAVAILNTKKTLCTKIGFAFAMGHAAFDNYKEVIYPAERYLKSYVTNAAVYKHRMSQNSILKQERDVDIDDYFTYNLKDADFVFHADETVPVIQFFYQIDYHYLKKDDEKEKAEKEKEKANADAKNQSFIYIIDKKGELKKIDIASNEKASK